jgi:group I intron endonuclease
MKSGIYCLSFEGTDKVYIGKSVNLESRAYSHEWNMKNQKASKKLQDAYNTYGTPIFTVLEYCNEKELYNLEKTYISEFNSVEQGFNHSPGGEGGNVSPGDINSRAVANNTQY